MTSDPTTRPPGPGHGPLPVGTKIVVGVLLLIPMLALALVPVYSRQTPKILGFPFFYWYQLLWVFLASVFTYTAFIVIKRARGEK
ncbi:MAG: DUF3311 domain-containing protein [Actinomycetota bacterium]|nr:DUF3311 domain-containing protein [Actinomycetota bacterium]